MRGGAFIFLALLGTSWVVARIGIVSITPSGQVIPAGAHQRPITQLSDTTTGPVHIVVRHSILTTHNQAVSTKTSSVAQMGAAVAVVAHSVSKRRRQRSIAPDKSTPLRISSAAQGISALPAAPDVPYSSPRGEGKRTRLFDVYAYSFWRRGNAPEGRPVNGQYGGSQSAIIANVPLLRFRTNQKVAQISLTGRYAVAHGASGEREFAAGLKWRPTSRVPIIVIAERRFRQDRSDAAAIFVAGGQSNVALPLDFSLDGYGQAGVVSGPSGGAFADVKLQTQRPVAQLGPTRVVAGAAIWAGGQEKILRADIGPSLAMDMPIGCAQFQLEGSWRFRLAGSADPGDGPAITLSTSF